jgi:integrase
MAAPLAWETVLRAGVSHSLARRGCRRGWSVANHRGLVRLNITAHAGGGRRRQLLLPIPWDGNHVDEVRDAVVALHSSFQDGVDLDEALVQLFPEEQPQSSASTELPKQSAVDAGPGLSWPALVELYRDHKLCSGEVKTATWERMYRPRMNLLLDLLATDTSGGPKEADALLRLTAKQWAERPGCRTRQLQVQYTSALLRWLVQQGCLGQVWDPPQDLGSFIGRSRQQRTVTTPMAAEHIQAMVRAIPDARWRLCFQLIAAYGLRPEEIQHLELRQGRLWCLYEKVAARGKTKPRPLRLLPCDQWAAAWNLEETYASDLLPPMRPGHGAQDISQYLRRRSLWMELKRDYEAQGEKLVLYSCRHAYAHRAHVICDLPPKVVAAAMGHSVQTHLAAYSRWCGDDVVDDAFAKAEQRLAHCLRAQSSAP